MTARTTIQVDEEALKMLERMKKERGVSSYSDLVKQLIREVKIIETSEKGSLPGLKSLKREKIDRFD
ncbi:MAG: ribbon-helix-helix protein, CopG family [archaeon]|nr:ribbon-helix-helix protein, CopG family [archaeon]